MVDTRSNYNRAVANMSATPFHQRHAELLGRMLPPVSYNWQGERMQAELAAEGAALDQFAAAANSIIDPSPWLFGHEALLPRWESLYQITPPLGATTDSRRTAVLSRIRAKGGLTLAYYTQQLAGAGWRAVLDEPREARAGVARAGDTIYKAGSVTWYWRARIRRADGSAATDADATLARSLLIPIAPSGTFFKVEI